MYEDDKFSNANFMILKKKMIKILFFQIVGNIKKWTLNGTISRRAIKSEYEGITHVPFMFYMVQIQIAVASC